LSDRKSIPVGEEPGAVISEVLFQVRPGVTSDRMADYPKKKLHMVFGSGAGQASNTEAE